MGNDIIHIFYSSQSPAYIVRTKAYSYLEFKILRVMVIFARMEFPKRANLLTLSVDMTLVIIYKTRTIYIYIYIFYP